MLWLSVLLVLALAAWFGGSWVFNKLRGDRCTARVPVTVAASPEIARAISDLAHDLTPSNACYSVEVTAQEPVSTLDALGAPGTARPDVWVPNSSVWLQRARDKGAWSTPLTGTSLATSPVVLAIDQGVANRRGWTARTPTWADVLGQAGTGLDLGVPDPARDPVGVSAIVAVKQLSDSPPTVTAMLRRLAANTASSSAELFERRQGLSTEPPVDAFPVSEHTLLSYNAKHPDTPMIAVYPPQVPGLDYPFVVLPGTADDHRSAAQQLLKTLLDNKNSPWFGSAELRNADGKLLSHAQGAPESMTPVAAPAVEQTDEALQVWAGVNRSARVQVVLDVSGSMATPVPGTTLTRMGVTTKAIEHAIGLFKASTKVGFWVFSTNLDGDKDYRELLPVTPISQILSSGALDQLRAITAKTGGATGLYDSTLAAYASARKSWEQGRLNIVVVMTDGRNEDPSGISRAQLLAELGKLADPHRPLPIIFVGIGPEVDNADLQGIAAATGGQAFTTADPAKINDVFYAALSRLACQPPSCG